MFTKRTDLALEAKEMWQESAEKTTRLSGVKAEKTKRVKHHLTWILTLAGGVVLLLFLLAILGTVIAYLFPVIIVVLIILILLFREKLLRSLLIFFQMIRTVVSQSVLKIIRYPLRLAAIP